MAYIQLHACLPATHIGTWVSKFMGFSKVSHTWRHGFSIRGTWGYGFLRTWLWHGIHRAIKGTLISQKWEHGFLPPSCRLTWVSPTSGYWFLLHTCMATWVSHTWGYLVFTPIHGWQHGVHLHRDMVFPPHTHTHTHIYIYGDMGFFPPDTRGHGILPSHIDGEHDAVVDSTGKL